MAIDQKLMFAATFSMLGKLSSADGAISRDEVECVNRVMDNTLKLNAKKKAYAVKIFTEARKSDSSFRDHAIEYRTLMQQKPKMLEWMVDLLLSVSASDNDISPTEEKMVKEASEVFGLSEERYLQLRAKHICTGVSDAYTLFGCSADDSDEQLEASYKRMQNEYDAEKMKALELPEEFQALAAQKLDAVEKAYQQILAHRSGR